MARLDELLGHRGRWTLQRLGPRDYAASALFARRDICEPPVHGDTPQDALRRLLEAITA